MHPRITDYAKNNKVEVPPDYIKIAELMHLSAIPHFILDLHGVGSHWFLEKPYQLLNPKHINSPELGQFEFRNLAVATGENVFTAANENFSDMLIRTCGIERSMVIAIANTMRERDTGLFYLFDESGKSEGLYIASEDLIDSEGKIRVGDSLEDIIHIPDNDSSIIDHKSRESYQFKQTNRPVKIGDIEKRASPNHSLVDINMNGIESYKNLMALFIKLSNDTFNPENIEYKESEFSIEISFSQGEKQYKVELVQTGDNSSEQNFYAIYTLLDRVNEAIQHSNDSAPFFLVYMHPDCETHVGIVFATTKLVNFLRKAEYIQVRG